MSEPYRIAVLPGDGIGPEVTTVTRTVLDATGSASNGWNAARAASVGEGIAVFEAVHDTPADWVGKNLANPLMLLGSAVLMLEHLGEREAATRIDAAIARVLEERKRVTRDLGGSARTIDMAKAIAEALD